ncbi:hypothetical protein [Halocalculus aciditolerans]|uniref:CRISPR-associated exonuclease Cas4 n=1 Tax=Halocalculus aciditolerans TaxID=1383812 RepID=A0A830F7K7_9EURY|nr:hypothetical protein [Halocalculus aciditolerans]GGL47629.1 hypothetical protein GCM10009039_02310 [Halocalculus aciditolerans]
MSDLVAFSDLALAAYCPRKLYYRRREDSRSEPPVAAQARSLAANYDALRSADPGPYAAALAVAPAVARERLDAAADRLDDFDALADPDESHVLVRGKDCLGRVGKITPNAVSVVSHGEPPDDGVWETQSVRAVAAANAVSWREQRRIDTAYVEYPRYGAIRRLSVTGRRSAAYRRALRTVEKIDGPPARLHDDAKCASCEYRATCGVQTRTLRSLL